MKPVDKLAAKGVSHRNPSPTSFETALRRIELEKDRNRKAREEKEARQKRNAERPAKTRQANMNRLNALENRLGKLEAAADRPTAERLLRMALNLARRIRSSNDLFPDSDVERRLTELTSQLDELAD